MMIDLLKIIRDRLDTLITLASNVNGSGADGQLTLWSGANTITGDTNLTFSRTSDNLGLRLETFGSSAAGVFGIGAGTAPTTSPADAVQLWAADRSAVAGKNSLHVRTEDGTSHVLGDLVGFGTVTPGTFGGVAIRLFASVSSRNVSLSTSDAANSTFDIRHGTGNLVDLSAQAGAISLSTGSAESVRIDTTGNVGIGVTTPNANAILDVTSTTKAFMPPRMTTAQRDAIASPTAGMVVYNTTTNKLNVFGAAAWEVITSV